MQLSSLVTALSFCLDGNRFRIIIIIIITISSSRLVVILFSVWEELITHVEVEILH
jgi:hypothetical protein